MHCLIQKVYNNFNTKPNYFNATYQNNNAVKDYILFTKMLRANNVIPIERSQPGQPLKWYANDFKVNFAVTDDFISNEGKTIQQFLEPDNTLNYAYWLYYGTSLQNIQWAGEIDVKSIILKLYPGEYSIECNVVSFEKHLEEYLKGTFSKRHPNPEDHTFYITEIFDPYIAGNPVLRFEHPQWNQAHPLNTVPFLSVPLYNAWLGQLLGTELGAKSAWDVFQAYVLETGAAWRIDPQPQQTVNGFRTYYVKIFFPVLNNSAITITKTKNYTEGITVSEKESFIHLLTRYELPNDPAQYVSGRYGYYFIRTKEKFSGYTSLNADLNPALINTDIALVRSYQEEAYAFPVRGFGAHKRNLLEMDSLAYWKDVNGYKVYVSFARCIVLGWQHDPGGNYYDSGFNLVLHVIMRNNEYLANGRKKNCQFETEYNANAKYAVSVNNFKGRDWWLVGAELDENDKKMQIKLIEK